MNRRETTKRPAIKVFLTVLGLGILCLALYFSLGPGNRLREEREKLVEDSSERAGRPQTVAVAGATDGGLEDEASITESYEETESEPDTVASVPADSEPATVATGMDSTGPPSEGWLATGHSEVPGKDGSKVSSIIRGVIKELRESGMTRTTGRSEEFRARSMKGIIRLDDEGNVQTYIYTEETSEEAREALEALGARIEIVDEEWGIVQAWIPFDQIDRVAGLELVKRIEAPDYGSTRTGIVTTEGDRILRANLVREAYGFNGAGTAVGVISDGVESRASAQSSGDLPASIEINPDLPGGVEDPEDEGSGDEGTAMLEIIHDLAPETSLAFSAGSDGLPTSLEMVRSIDWLANSAFDGAGVDIIVDDLGFLGEPFFEDGPVARKVKEVVANGTVYVSAAGNDSDEHYEGEFADDGSGFHDFGGGDRTMRVTLEEDGGVFLQWNDRFGSSGNDYDLYGCIEGVAPSQTAVDAGDCISSTAEQDGDDNPKERLINEESSDRVLDLYIKKSSGSSRRLEMHFIDATVHEHNVPEGSVYGHAAVPGALAVGAIQADDFGHDTIAPYSSRGPSEIYYPSRETRMKPDIVATDGVSITGAGNFRSLFFGTSAAAPHAAAVAALLLEAIRNDDSTIAKTHAAQQVSNTLLGTAFDLGDTGVDNVYGAGRVDALLAVSGGNEVVYFERPTYAAVESLYTPEVEVKLTAALDEEAVIPITVTKSGAVAADYTIEGLEGSAPNHRLRIPANALSTSFTVSANADTEDEDGENITLEIGASLPDGVVAVPRGAATMNLLDIEERGDAPGICGRLAPVRELILSKLVGEVDCADITLAHRALITDLSLDNEGITSLRRIDFEGLTNLRGLYLGYNQLTTLPAGVFEGLTSLRELYLGHSQLTTLPAGVFEGLTSLRWLYLEYNQLTTLPARVFEGLSSLEGLSLEGNQLTTLSAGVFEGLTNLPTLSLQDNQLTTLPAGVFEGLSSLESLSLQGNLTTLPVGVFEGLTNLKSLSLQGNLTTLPVGVFEGLTNLEVLELKYHQLTTLLAGVFNGLTNLQILDLSHNQLATLPTDVFGDMISLEWLHLHDNQLITLPAEVFDGLANLQILLIDQNPGAPFTLSLELERFGSGHRSGTVHLQVRMAEGAPFATTVTWTATGDINGTASDSVTVPAGSLVSEPFSVTGANSGGRVNVALSNPTFEGNISSGLALAAGDPLVLDFTMIPAIGEQFGLNEDIPGMPTGDWTPDFLSRASFSQVGGQTTVMFGPGGRMEEDGDTYTCMSSGGCRIEGTRVSMGTVLVSDAADASGLMVAGLGELVDEKTVFKETTYNGFELKDSTVTTRSVAGETTRVSFLDLDGDLVFVDFSSDDPATEMVITLEEYSGALEGSPYNQPDTQYAQGLATIWIMNPTELTWLSVVSLGNDVDRVDLALVKEDTFATPVNGMADIRAISIEGDGNIGAIDATNVNFVGSSGEIGIDAQGTVVVRALSIGDITPSETAMPVLRISGDSLNPANVGQGETVIDEIRIAGGDLREATGDLRIDTNGVVYPFPIVAADGVLSIRDSDLRQDLGDGQIPAVSDTFVANPGAYFVTDGQTTGAADTAD